jgi:hypothetical protein
LAGIAFVGPLALYAITLSPGVDFWDTGEMQTVPYVLGIAHPTGFPLFVILGWCFSHVFVAGNVAWRLSLFSALASAAAAGLLFVFVLDITRSALVGLAAALAFAAGDIVWTRAIRAEVHDLALAFTALALVLALRAADSGSAHTLAWAALAAGLGLATHPVVALAVPAALVFAWPALRSAGWRARAGALLALLGPLAFYAYVPLRSAFVEAHRLDPARDAGVSGGAFFDYGAPATARAFWAYVTGAAFAPGHAFAAVTSAAGARRAFALAHELVYHEYSFAALAFAIVGFGYLIVTQRRLAVGLVLLFCGALAFVPNYAAESDSARYALPALWALSACAAAGAAWVARCLVGERPRAASLLGAAAIVGGLWPNAGFAQSDVTHQRAFNDARDVGREVASRTPDGSLIVAAWTFATPLAYDAYVERTFGSRRLLSGWPHEFRGRYGAWRARYKHVYFVVDTFYDVTRLGHTLFRDRRWQLAEMR